MNIVINGNIYIMPMGELNKELLTDIIVDDTVDVDNLGNNIVKLYQNIYRVFELLCHSVMMFSEDSVLQKDVQRLGKEMWRVDSLITFYAKKGKYEAAIKHMKEFMVSMLEPFQNVDKKRQVRQ